MYRYSVLAIFVFVVFSGCITPGGAPSNAPEVAASQHPTASPTSVQPTVQPTAQKPDRNAPADENYSVAVEVDYRKYVDWFMAYNINIRAYTPEEYVCGQYTADMINASKKAGFKAYFAAIKFSDGTGHALVAFKSTRFNYTSWYFFEPQTNGQMTPQTIRQTLSEKIGKTVTEITVYDYFDDAGDRDPTTWRFAYPLYNIKY